MNAKQEQYQKEVTERILKLMEGDSLEWIRPWKNGANAKLPVNGVSRKPYNGANVFTLWVTAILKGYSSHQWVTFKQAGMMGGQIRKGEKSTEVFFWSPIDSEEKNEDGSTAKRKRFIFKTYYVLNVEQTTIDPAKYTQTVEPENQIDPIIEAESFVNGIRHEVSHVGNAACYVPSQDLIRMPKWSLFRSAESYYSTYLHELTHWTGHTTRLHREGVATLVEQKGHTKQIYAFEELVAELGSAFLCAGLGINEAEVQHAAYLQSWITLLKEDSTAFFRAASLASKAVEYLYDHSKPAEVAA